MRIQPLVRLTAIAELKSPGFLRHIPNPLRFRMLVAAVKRDGVILPVIVDSGHIVHGQITVHAARAAGISHVWTADVSGLSQYRKRVVTQRLTRSGWEARL